MLWIYTSALYKRVNVFIQPLHYKQEETQRQFFKQSGLNSEFSFSKVKEPSLFYYL